MSLPLVRVGAIALALAVAVPGGAAAAEPPRPESTESYIVQAAPGALDDLNATLDDLGAAPDEVYDDVLDGVAVDLTSSQAAALARSGDATRVVPDTPIATTDIQTPPPSWGLDRIDQAIRPLSSTYAYDPLAGAGVRVYVVDTGVTPRSSFGSRLLAGYTTVADGWGTRDCVGHGTHVAGTVASTVYGVAKKASVVPVRVLDCWGEGSAADLIEGLDWIAAHHPAGTPGVVNLSLSGPANSVVNDAVSALVTRGLTVTVAAGNDDVDACTASPASASPALTIGATTTADVRADYSNWGSCLDLYAPGSSIVSLDAFDPVGAVVASGTSMAAPHVAGIAALYLAQMPAATPNQVRAALLGAAHRAVGDNEPVPLANSNVVPPPGAPDPLVVTATTTSTIALEWAAPHQPAATSFRVAWRPVGAQVWQTRTVTTVGTSVTGLAPDTDYEVTVTGQDSGGAGPASAVLTTRTSNSPSPSAPTNLSFDSNQTSITVSWTAPDVGAADVTGFAVDLSSDGSSWTPAATTDAATLTATLDGLVPATEYHVRVGAITGTGSGVHAYASASTQGRLPVPADVRVVSVSTTEIRLSYFQSLLGQTLTGFEIEASTDGQTWQVLATPATSEVTLSGLTPSTTYRLRVTAITTVGRGTTSTPIAVTTNSPAGGPNALRATVTPDGAMVMWNQPLGPVVAGWAFEWSSDGVNFEPVTPSDLIGGGGFVTLSGLVPETTYWARAAAVADGTPGPWSTIAFETAPVPTAPARLMTRVSQVWASFGWSTPEVSSGLVAEYVVQSLVDGVWGGDVTVRNSNSLSWSTLSPGTTYQRRVAPVTASGVRGPWATTSFTTLPATSEPTEISITPGTHGAVVTWQPPANPPVPISGYVVRCGQSTSGGSTYGTLTSSDRWTTCGGLQPGQVSTFRVAAIGGVAGTWAETSATLPSLPGAPTASASATETTATVQWLPPSLAPEQVTGYLVEVLYGSQWVPEALLGADGRRATVGGLLPGTSYRIRLTPISELDAGTPSVVDVRTSGSAAWMSQLTLSPDLTGDGTGDIVGVDLAGNLKVYTTANARVGSLALSGPGWAPLTVYAPGDWNTDGRNDLIARTTTGDLWLYPGNGRGGLGAASKIGNGWTGYRVVPAGDVNGDGRADLLAIDPDGYLWLYPGAGAGKFGRPIKVGNGWNDFELYAAGDQNLDGKVDILGIDPAGRLWYYAGRGGGYFWQRAQVGNGWNGFEFASGADLTGDGIGDLIGRDAQHRLWLYPGKAAGGFLMRVQIGTGW